MLAPQPVAPVAAAIFLGAIALVITRPRGLTEAGAALLGAAVMVGAGVISPADAAASVAGAANVLLFFLGLTGTAAVAERAGVPEAIAGSAARRAGGRPRALLAGVVLAGAAVGALLSNDAAALVLTPVAFVLATRSGLHPLPFALACTFVADAVSIALPVSNPVNVIVTDRLGIPAASLIGVLLPAAAASVAALLVVLLVAFRGSLPERVAAPAALGGWAAWSSIPPVLLLGFAGAVVAFVAASAADVPLGPTMTAVWLALLALERLAAARTGRPAAPPLRGVGWSLLAFVAGMGVLVRGLEAAGITGWLASLVVDPAAPPAGTLLATTLAAAAGSNLVNNLPAAFVLSTSIAGAGLDPGALHAAAVGTIIGADLGPNLTPIGSVATMLWFVLLRQRGYQVSAWAYIRMGLVVTPLTLVAAVATALLLLPAR